MTTTQTPMGAILQAAAAFRSADLVTFEGNRARIHSFDHYISEAFGLYEALADEAKKRGAGFLCGCNHMASCDKHDWIKGPFPEASK